MGDDLDRVLNGIWAELRAENDARGVAVAAERRALAEQRGGSRFAAEGANEAAARQLHERSRRERQRSSELAAQVGRFWHQVRSAP